MAAWAGVAEKDRGALSDNPNGVTLVESGAYTAAPAAGAEFSADQSAIVEVVIVATAKAATPVVCFCVEGYNEASGTWENLIGPSAALTDAGIKYLQVNPFTPAVASISAQRVTRRKMRVTATHEDTDALTFSVRAYGIPR